MKQKLSEKDELEIKKAPEELTEKDLKMVAGGIKQSKNCYKYSPDNRKSDSSSI